MPRVNNVIQQVSQLNTYEQEKVFDFLKTILMSNGITNSIDEEIAENRFNKGKCCPFCNHDKISKYGKYHGKNGVKQRYKCQNPECKKTFNDFSKSPVSSSKKGLDKWLLYAQCMINGNTIRQCAEIVEINIATAFFWRHKIIDAIRKFIGYGSLEGVIELDETYFALSYKGNHSKSSNFTMPRESRKRGKEINTRGISKEFACVLCGVDRLGNIYTGLICDGRPNYTDINRALSEVVEENSILCTDKHRSYIPFAAQHNFELHQIRGGRKTVDIYNIQRVNAFHSSLKRWIRKFNGVSTKFLTNYLFWYKWTQLFKTEIERNKPKKFFIHANSTHSISLIKDFKIRRPIYV